MLSNNKNLHILFIILKKEYRKGRVLDLILFSIPISLMTYFKTMFFLPLLLVITPLRFLNIFWNSFEEKKAYDFLILNEIKRITVINKLILFIELNIIYILINLAVEIEYSNIIVYNLHLLIFVTVCDYFFFSKLYNKEKNKVIKMILISTICLLFSSLVLILDYFVFNTWHFILISSILFFLQIYITKNIFNEQNYLTSQKFT